MQLVEFLGHALTHDSGAKVLFGSLIQPVFGRFFQQGGSTSANLRSQAESAAKTN